MESYHTKKETINKAKRQIAEWKQIFANDIIYKELISKMDNELTTQHQRNEWLN